ncbi:transposase [uncultured Desulfobacter sp.]|uniref:transposase n=1 Tax=uncultured Desulfobacter sp. TaxID=240139 RepID=UPI0037499444
MYRGVISENIIIANRDGKVPFKYTDSKTKSIRYRTLKDEDFLHLILLHVLPRGFRRTRDYGFCTVMLKRCFHILKQPGSWPGLFNNRIRSWFVSHTIYPYSFGIIAKKLMQLTVRPPQYQL